MAVGGDGPSDPMTALGAGVSTIHELFVSFVAAGFSESQALYLVGCVLTANLRPLPPQP